MSQLFQTISFKSERHFFFLSERDNEYPCSTLIFATLLYVHSVLPAKPPARLQERGQVLRGGMPRALLKEEVLIGVYSSGNLFFHLKHFV